ncbi:MAG TPA: long-chain fatty acid--CoA ligase, partial [Paludibacteraceae bacterium]|nr:long-chain fatty acid--CoA ligase [Paludibacteraceae bacterium]
PYVMESVVVERKNMLVALVFPDNEAFKNENTHFKNMEEQMEHNLVRLNRMLPPFCRLTQIELVDKEFEKTPKRSIKRFMYS